MAVTYKVRDIKKLAPVDGSDTSEGMAIVRADITIGSQSDVGATATGSVVLSGALLSNLGLGSTGKVVDVVGAQVYGSAGALRMLIPVFNQENETVFFWRHGSASNATEFVEASSPAMETGDILRLTLLGRIGG